MGLSEVESKTLSALVAEGKTIITTKDLVEKLGSTTLAHLMASRLVKKKWLERLRNGVYLALELAAGEKPAWSEDTFYIASHLANPYYVGYYGMLNYYGWTEQLPSVTQIVTTKRIANKTVLELRFEFITVAPHKFFGFNKIHRSGHWVHVSDPEKTIVDALDNPSHAGGINEIAKSLHNAKNLDYEKLVDYALKMKNRAILKRLGYLAELMEINIPEKTRHRIQKNISAGYSLLWPGMEKKGRYNAKWKLLLNTETTKENVLA